MMQVQARRPLNIAHRGGAGLTPENTMAAFEHAAGLGVDGFELDVHLTKDGVLAVYHDEALKPDITRDANDDWLEATGPLLKDMSWADLQTFDVGRAKPGSAYAQSHPRTQWCEGARIPRLDEVLHLARHENVRVLIEIKSNFYDRSKTAPPKVMAAAVVDAIARCRADAFSIVIGFDWVSVLEAKRLASHLPVWLTTLPQSWFGQTPPPKDHWPPDSARLEVIRAWEAGEAPRAAGFDRARYGALLKAIKAAGAEAWFPFHPDLTQESVAEARALNLKVGGWTVNDGDHIERLLSLGIDAICTDFPDDVGAAIRKKWGVAPKAGQG